MENEEDKELNYAEILRLIIYYKADDNGFDIQENDYHCPLCGDTLSYSDAIGCSGSDTEDMIYILFSCINCRKKSRVLAHLNSIQDWLGFYVKPMVITPNLSI